MIVVFFVLALSVVVSAFVQMFVLFLHFVIQFDARRWASSCKSKCKRLRTSMLFSLIFICLLFICLLLSSSSMFHDCVFLYSRSVIDNIATITANAKVVCIFFLVCMKDRDLSSLLEIVCIQFEMKQTISL